MDKCIYIIIPVFNRRDYTKNCVLSLKNQTYTNHKIIVVDDGSTDGTKEMLEKEFPEVKVIHRAGNLWWTKATNIGVQYALDKKADYVFTLNNDTIAFPDMLEKLVYSIKNNEKILQGVLAIDKVKGIEVYGGERINWLTATYTNLLIEKGKHDNSNMLAVTHYPGRGLLIPSEVFEKLGLFDEKHFPHYGADYDFTHHALKAGYKIYCNYEAKIYIYPIESHAERIRKKKTLRNYFLHLFSIKGGGNIKVFFYYSLRNCPRKYLPLFFTLGMSRRILGYLFREE